MGERGQKRLLCLLAGPLEPIIAFSHSALHWQHNGITCIKCEIYCYFHSIFHWVGYHIILSPILLAITLWRLDPTQQCLFRQRLPRQNFCINLVKNFFLKSNLFKLWEKKSMQIQNTLCHVCFFCFCNSNFVLTWVLWNGLIKRFWFCKVVAPYWLFL